MINQIEKQGKIELRKSFPNVKFPFIGSDHVLNPVITPYSNRKEIIDTVFYFDSDCSLAFKTVSLPSNINDNKRYFIR